MTSQVEYRTPTVEWFSLVYQTGPFPGLVSVPDVPITPPVRRLCMVEVETSRVVALDPLRRPVSHK